MVIDTLTMLNDIEVKLNAIYDRLEIIEKGNDLPYHETLNELHEIREKLSGIGIDIEFYDHPCSRNSPEKHTAWMKKSKIVNNLFTDSCEYVTELLAKIVGCAPSMVLRTMYPNGNPDWE